MSCNKFAAETYRVPQSYCADCFDILPSIPDHSIDMILCDLPYNITQNSWDSPLPLEDYIIVGESPVTLTELRTALWDPRNQKAKRQSEFCGLLSQPMGDIMKFWNENKKQGLWSHYKRIIKPHGVIVLFGAGMFSAELMRAGKDLWRYNLI